MAAPVLENIAPFILYSYLYEARPVRHISVQDDLHLSAGQVHLTTASTSYFLVGNLMRTYGKPIPCRDAGIDSTLQSGLLEGSGEFTWNIYEDLVTQIGHVHIHLSSSIEARSRAKARRVRA